MKKYILILAFYLHYQNASAQAFNVGDINCNYTVINQTLTPSQTFTLDIDGDLINDIAFTCGYCNSSSNCYYYYVQVSSTSLEFAEDNSASPSVVKNLAFASAINSNPNWMTTGYLHFSNYSFSSSFMWGQQINPFYVGFRKILSNDTIYGWIKTDSWFTGQIFSIGYKSVSDTVAWPTPSITNTLTNICASDSLILNATPSGGYFFGPGVSGNTFYSGSLSAGNYNVMYCMTPSPVICSGKAIQTISVSACTGINEQSFVSNSILIFPNPSNDEFEIKVERESKLNITNELGQHVKTIELNSDNNFSTKLNDLQSGIYFIGNNSARQKIVVIK